jgi:hypothetical protein
MRYGGLQSSHNFIACTARHAYCRQLPSGRWQAVYKDCCGNYQGSMVTYKTEEALIKSCNRQY